MNKKICLGNSGHEPSNEERVHEERVKEWFLREAAETPMRRFYFIDVHGLSGDGLVIRGYAASEPRDSDNPMRITLADGTTQGEFLFYLSELRERAENDWDWLTAWGGGGHLSAPPNDQGGADR